MLSPKSYLTEEYKLQLEEYAKNLKADLEKTDLGEQTKEEYFATMLDYKLYVLASKSLVDKYAKLAKTNQKINQRYRSEQNEEEAQKLKNEYLKNKQEMGKISKENSEFKNKAAEMENKVKNIDKIIDSRKQSKNVENGKKL